MLRDARPSLCCALLLLAPPAVSAAVVIGPATFSDRTSWEAAAGDAIELEDFESVGPVTALTSGDTFGLAGFDLVIAPNHGGIAISAAGAITGTQGLRADIHGSSDPAFVILAFDRPVFAFGADFADLNEGGLLDVRVGGTSFAIPDGSGFFGVVAASPFSRVELRTTAAVSQEFFRMDNVGFVPVPEPGAPVLALLASAAAMRRRRRV